MLFAIAMGQYRRVCVSRWTRFESVRVQMLCCC